LDVELDEILQGGSQCCEEEIVMFSSESNKERERFAR